MTLAIHHTAIVVADLARAEAFYAGVLGLAVERRWTDDAGKPRSVWLALGGGQILMLERAEVLVPRRADGAPGWHCLALAIPVDEREAWRARLATARIPVERESAYSLYLRDPDGALVALSHWPVAAGGERP
jgi:hypothetical protein